MWLKFFNKPEKAHSDVPKKRVTVKRPKFSYQWRYWSTIKNFFRTLYRKVMGSVPSGGNLTFSSYYKRLLIKFFSSSTSRIEHSSTRRFWYRLERWKSKYGQPRKNTQKWGTTNAKRRKGEIRSAISSCNIHFGRPR
jgi:hypothetical protein